MDIATLKAKLKDWYARLRDRVLALWHRIKDAVAKAKNGD